MSDSELVTQLLVAAIAARVVIAHDRNVLVESFKNRHTGKVEDASALPWLKDYDATLANLDAAIAKATKS